MLKNLPPKIEIETTKVLKKAIQANRALAKLNGVAKIIPNSQILINSLVMQEAKDSSEIENIATTHDELYRANVDGTNLSNNTKEVQSYSKALLLGFDLVSENKLLLKKYIVQIQKELEQNDAGIRRQSGTVLKNEQTGEVIYTPPQDFETVDRLMSNLEAYINEPNEIDPLVNMAMIHYQFESIHPFYDGNGRTGRIVNILYLIQQELLDLPILYLSSYIIQNKSDYYRLLQEVRTEGKWEEWILYMLEGVEVTALATIELINDMSVLMEQIKNTIQDELPKIYSKDLVEILHMHPFTKIEFLVDILGLHRETASKYLKELERIGVVQSLKLGKTKYFVNVHLFELLKRSR
jgi:Fic family protein